MEEEKDQLGVQIKELEILLEDKHQENQTLSNQNKSL